MLQPEGPHGNGLVFTASNRVGSAGQRPAGVPARPLPGLHRRPAPPLWPHPSPSVGLAAPPPSKELCGQQQSCPIVLEGVQERTAADGFWKKVEKIRGKRSEGRRNLPPQSRLLPSLCSHLGEGLEGAVPWRTFPEELPHLRGGGPRPYCRELGTLVLNTGGAHCPWP